MKTTKHFSVEEFDRKEKRGLGLCPYPNEWIDSRLRLLCNALEVVREACGGRTIAILSGYRDHAYNVAIGGAKFSQHVEGRAADITVAGMSAARVHEIVLELLNAGRIPLVRGLGKYPGFTHVDVRPGVRLARWEGTRKSS